MADLYVTLVAIYPAEATTLTNVREQAEAGDRPQTQWPLMDSIYTARRKNQVRSQTIPSTLTGG